MEGVRDGCESVCGVEGVRGIMAAFRQRFFGVTSKPSSTATIDLFAEPLDGVSASDLFAEPLDGVSASELFAVDTRLFFGVTSWTDLLDTVGELCGVTSDCLYRESLSMHYNDLLVLPGWCSTLQHCPGSAASS